MDAKFEDLSPVVQGRLKSIESAVAKVCTAEKTLGRATLLERFFATIPVVGRLLVQKDIGDAVAFAIDFFTRDAAWIDNATGILYLEGLETAREAIAAQLGSAFGKALPDDFVFSTQQKRMIWERARFSAESVAATYNSKLSLWAQEVKDAWIAEHGSLKGLQRWTIIKRMGRFHHDFSAWKESQVAVTEFGQQWRDAVEFFADANLEMELECQILPEHASERDTPIFCSEFAGLWFPLREALSLTPQHINCIHYIGQSRNIGKVPIYMNIGLFGYRPDSLEEA